MSITVIAFVDLQLKDEKDWKSGDKYQEDGVARSIKNNAEIHLVAIDGTFRHLFFAKKSLIRITGNTLWFNDKDSDYLVTDHNKKLSNNPKIDD